MKRRDFLIRLTTAMATMGISQPVFAQMARVMTTAPRDSHDGHIKDYLHKMSRFDCHHRGDMYLTEKDLALLKSSLYRLTRVQRVVGHGNFNLLSFDQSIQIARSYSRVGRFTRNELEFLEMLFYSDSSQYGFLGEKPLKQLTARIPTQKVTKISSSGNFVYTGQPLSIYRKIKQDLGTNVVLTSGIRSVTKQFMLFLNKAYHNRGNLSLASRSLAPPGYSYHGVGDFDVGQIGFGAANFTARFTTTPVFQKLKDLGYVDLRYRRDNLLGVRFEPWHIKVNSFNGLA